MKNFIYANPAAFWKAKSEGLHPPPSSLLMHLKSVDVEVPDEN